MYHLFSQGRYLGGHGFNPLLRNNLTGAMILKTQNMKELDKMEEEFSGFPEFLDMYEYATREPYGFLYLNLEKDFAMKNFSEVLYKKYD